MNDVLAEVCALRGETTLYDFALARDVAECEITRRACWRLWRKHAATLTVEQILMLRRDAMKAASEQSRNLRLLGLDHRKAADIWDSLHTPTNIGGHEPQIPGDAIAQDGAGNIATEDGSMTVPPASDSPESTPERDAQEGEG